MITIERQQNLLLSIARRLDKKITAYAIGGTAMMFLGLKEATLDIDLVFENESDRKAFRDAAVSLGYKEMNPIKVYGVKRNQPEMVKLDDERFDLFVNAVIDFVFSDEIKKRAEQKHQFEDKLILRIANPHDIILMKCATDRQKDKDDARRIINGTEINWKVIIEEAKNQMKLGRERAVIDLGFFLEELGEMKVNIPKDVLDELWEIAGRKE